MAGSIPDEVILGRLRQERAERERSIAELLAQIETLGGEIKSRFSKLEAKVKQIDGRDATASITELAAVVADEGYAMAMKYEELKASLDNENSPEAFIRELKRVEATSTYSLAEIRTDLHAGFAKSAADIHTILQTYATKDYAQALDSAVLSAAHADATAKVEVERLARASATEALAQNVTTLSASVGGLTGRIDTEETTRATETSALAERTDTLEAQVQTPIGGLLARVSTVETTYATQSFATAKKTEAIEAAAQDASGKVTTEQEARVNADGTVAARASLEVDANGHVAGYRIGSATNLAGTPHSEFIIVADLFAVSHGTTVTYPFSIVDGVTHIQNAKIGGLMINSDKLTSGAVNIGSTLAAGMRVGSNANWARVGLGPQSLPAFALLHQDAEGNDQFRGSFYLAPNPVVPGDVTSQLQVDTVSAELVSATNISGYIENQYFRATSGNHAVDALDCNLRVMDGENPVIVLNKLLKQVTINGNRVLGERFDMSAPVYATDLDSAVALVNWCRDLLTYHGLGA